MDLHDNQTWWDVIKTVSNLIAMVLAVGFGWLTKKFTSTEADMKAMAIRIDDVEEGLLSRTQAIERDLLARHQEAATSIAVLKSYHQSNIKRLDTIEQTANKIDGKLDALIIRLSSPPAQK